MKFILKINNLIIYIFNNYDISLFLKTHPAHLAKFMANSSEIEHMAR